MCSRFQAIKRAPPIALEAPAEGDAQILDELETDLVTLMDCNELPPGVSVRSYDPPRDSCVYTAPLGGVEPECEAYEGALDLPEDACVVCPSVSTSCDGDNALHDLCKVSSDEGCTTQPVMSVSSDMQSDLSHDAPYTFEREVTSPERPILAVDAVDSSSPFTPVQCPERLLLRRCRTDP